MQLAHNSNLIVVLYRWKPHRRFLAYTMNKHQEFINQVDDWFKLAFVGIKDVEHTTLPLLSDSRPPTHQRGDDLWEWEIVQHDKMPSRFILGVQNHTPEPTYTLMHYPCCKMVCIAPHNGGKAVFATDGLIMRSYPWTPAGFVALTRALLEAAGDAYYAA